ETMVDATKPGLGTLTAKDATPVARLTDDSMTSSVIFGSDSAELTWASAAGPVSVHQYTLTSTTDPGAAAPTSWTLEGSLDGTTWTTLDTREGQTFPFGTQVRPFTVSGDGAAYSSYRLSVRSAPGTTLGLAEVELFAKASAADSVSLSAASEQQAKVGQEFSGNLATLTGPAADASAYTVLVSPGDGGDPVAATLTANGLGGWSVSAPHTYDKVGTYTVTVSATDSEGSAASVTTQVTVSRDASLQGSFTNTCIADSHNGASCDGQGSGYKRADLESAGFVAGKTLPLGTSGLTYDLPLVEPGQPDNATGEGQTISLDLGAGATRISLVGTATESDKDLKGVLTFTDGSTQEIPLQFGDWVGKAGNPAFGNSVVAVSNGRMIGTSPEAGNPKRSAVFATAPVELAKDAEGTVKTVVSLTLPQEKGTLAADGRIHLFAIASDGARSATEALALAPSEDLGVEAGSKLSAVLATVTGGRPGAALTATVNWGDGSALVDATVTDGRVEGTHTYAAAGTHTVRVSVDDGVRSASTQLQVTVRDGAATYDPVLTVPDGAVAPGAQVQVGGTGFAPGESVVLSFAGSSTTAIADAAGAFSTSLQVPTDATPGVQVITALGDVSKVEAQARVTVSEPDVDPVATRTQLAASASEVMVNQPFRLTATLSPDTATGTVRVYEGDTELGSGVVSGGVATVDLRLATSGVHVLSAEFVPDNPQAFAGSTSESVEVSVTSAPVGEASIQLSHSSRMRGETLGVTGTGFTAGESVRISLGSDPIQLATVTADATGSFALTVTIPQEAVVGDHAVIAVGQVSGLKATADLTVADRPVPGDNGAGASSGGSTGGSHGLAVTGATGVGVLALVAASLFCGGLALKVRRRRHLGATATEGGVSGE
ncbi:MAG: Ig-like domain repeat protein, partial [Actinomyces sp.]|nr:Ig-like domain repeat protein [Actinomyces sp.]